MINVTCREYEFGEAFIHYLSTLPEYEPVFTPSFGSQRVCSNFRIGFRSEKPHLVRVLCVQHKRGAALPFPVRLGNVVYRHTPGHGAWRNPLQVLGEAMTYVVESKTLLPINHRRRVVDALHPDFRSLLVEAESLALRAALISSTSWHDSPTLT